MKKQLLLVGITIMLLTIGLSGCTQEDTTSGEMKKFIGTWNADVNDVFIFSENGACKYVDTSGTYSVENNQLSTVLNNGQTRTYTYEFSDNGNTLALTTIPDNVVITEVTTIYTRQ